MLTITLPDAEFFDESTSRFITKPGVTLQLEHSLSSLSKWESFYEKPFISDEKKTSAETVYYVYCMIQSPMVELDVAERIPSAEYDRINAYINHKQTATWFKEVPQRGGRQVITAEIIYYWMASMNVDFSCADWHLARLFTLLKVISQKNAPPKKMSRQEMNAQNQRLNAARRAQYGTNG